MMKILDNLHIKYRNDSMQNAFGRDPAMTIPNNSIPLIKGPQSYSYTGDGLDYRSAQASRQPHFRRDWDPNISGKFNGSGVDYNYTQGNFAASRNIDEPVEATARGTLGGDYTSVAAGQLFRSGENMTVEQDVLYALIGSAIEQYIQNSILLWILSAIGIIVWLITIVLIVQLTFPQYVPRKLLEMPIWQKIQKVDIQWWLILAILLTSLVGLNFPSVQNFLMMLLGIMLIVWFGIRWAAKTSRQWIVLAVGVILLFSGAVREYIDYSANAFFTTIMRWPSMLSCVLLLVDIFYVSKQAVRI